MPDILLEGDQPSPPPSPASGQAHDLPAGARPTQTGHAPVTLPESYGTGRLLLVAREPHWLYAWWDLTPHQQRRYNVRSVEGHLVVRVRGGAAEEQPALEVPVHPESRHWFIHVERASAQYVAELGYYTPRRQWVKVAVSNAARTPPDTVSTDQTLRFATIPFEAHLREVAAPASQAVSASPQPLKSEAERVLAELVTPHSEAPGGPSSAELVELARGLAGQELPTAPITSFAPALGEGAGVSSPMGPPEQPAPGFWFNVNAEVVIYGATEPDVTLTIGGQPVPLRPDGTFSCRYALPDGEHEVTVSAMSARGDLRQARLQFSRRTEHRGEVAAAPQDPSLAPPTAQNP